jgi:rhodanese-related sulfurtransferase
MKTVSIQEIPHNAVIIDVRTPIEHAEAHLQRAHDHVPLDTLNPADFMMRRGLDKDAGVYILCRSGSRATMAAQKFEEAGFANVNVIEGGISGSEDAGEPVVKNNAAANSNGPAIDLEKAKGALNGFYAKMGSYSLGRQLEMILGTVIVISMLLGFADVEFFFIFPLLIGAALFLKGMTGFCMGEKLLMKAPWNKSAVCTKKSSGGTCA